MPDTTSTLIPGRLVTPTGVVDDGALVVSDDRIRYAGPARDLPAHLADAASPDGWPSDLTVLPGLVDLHCHGGGGAEFGPDPDEGRVAAHHHHHAGTTSLLGSLVSARPDRLVAGVTACAGLVAGGELAGIHLEGPFLSYERRGAQDPDALTDVDVDLVESLAAAASSAGAPDALVQMTFAPERPGARALPRQLARHGVIASVGHTDSDVDTAWAALREVRELGPRGGRPLVTHVFNGMRPLRHRDPGPVAAALAQAARGDAVLEVVGDGVHLAAGTVRMLFDVVGPGGLALITDSMAASGMPDGTYSLGGREVVVADRTARLTDGGSIAGGVATMLDVLRWCVLEAGVLLEDAVAAASSTPAQTASLDDVGRLEAGARADVLVVDAGLTPHAVMRGGVWLG